MRGAGRGRGGGGGGRGGRVGVERIKCGCLFFVFAHVAFSPTVLPKALLIPSPSLSDTATHFHFLSPALKSLFLK